MSCSQILARLRRLRSEEGGSVLLIFALAVFPLIGFVAAAVDYSRAADDREKMQAALDAGVLAGAMDGTAQWATVAGAVFAASFQPRSGSAIPTPTFSKTGDRYSATANTITQSRLLTPLGIQQIAIGASTAVVAAAADSDTSCILTLGQGQGVSATSMTFNGSPNVNLSGCTLRSNTSMRCNGHSTGASGSISAGTTAGCSNPESNANAVQDIYKALVSNIATVCTSYPGTTWTPATVPGSPGVRTAARSGWTEYHVCGNLTLSGSGNLAGTSQAGDTVIVVENGKITVDGDAAITARRTAFVLTGDNSVASLIEFPNGNGHGASLTITPPMDSLTPWAGISIYQNPALTNGVDADWGPGATLIADGIVYLPNADLTLRGNAKSSATACSKLVVNTLTVNGSVDMNHVGSTCSSLGVKQWSKAANPRMVQ